MKKKEANGLQVSKTIDLTNLTTYLQRVTLPDEKKEIHDNSSSDETVLSPVIQASFFILSISFCKRKEYRNRNEEDFVYSAILLN